MSFQAPISIADAISRIQERTLLLPAIQREFVWEPEKVEWFFDSLLQGYPIGSFLFWEVRDAKTKGEYRFYEVLRQFRQRYQTHNPEVNTNGHKDFYAVLDGQQRLTSLYIGLAGTYAYKQPRVWWENNEKALPTRKLYLNVKEPPSNDNEQESGRLFEFRFLTTDEHNGEAKKWFLAGRLLQVSGAYQFNQLLKEEGYLDDEFASSALARLHAAIHTERLLNYYLVQKADMELALNIFVRVNSGGEPLSLSDMLMSTAIANWAVKDARKEITGLVDEVGAKGFFISKDLVLKACLYLYSADIRYKVSNFSAAQVKPFEDNWEQIADSIRSVFLLVRDFGFNEKTLTSKNALLPIVYWVHHKKLQQTIVTSVAAKSERDKIRGWLHAMLLKGIFGGSADTVLAAIRKVFFDGEFGKAYIASDILEFPSDAIGAVLQAQGKDPNITDDFLDSLLYTQYEDKEAFSILALLAPNLDYQNGDFHKDHLHPISIFRRKKLLAAGILESDLDYYLDTNHCNSILNLRHLDSNENKSKQDTPLRIWAVAEAKRQKTTVQKFCMDRDLPDQEEDLDLGNFKDFISKRRAVLRERLRTVLQSSAVKAAKA